MPFSRFVEIGRVVLITYGPLTGKLAVIVDVLDQARLFVHGPTTGVVRQVIPTKRVALTKFTVKVSRGARAKTLTKAIAAADLLNKWNATSWAKKIAQRKTRQTTTDFDRFKLMVAKRTRSAVVNQEYNKLLKAQKRSTAAKLNIGRVAKKVKGAAAKPAAAKPAAAKPAAAKGGKGKK